MATMNHQNATLCIFNSGSLVKDAIFEKFDNISKSHLPENAYEPNEYSVGLLGHLDATINESILGWLI